MQARLSQLNSSPVPIQTFDTEQDEDAGGAEQSAHAENEYAPAGDEETQESGEDALPEQQGDEEQQPEQDVEGDQAGEDEEDAMETKQ